MIPRILVVQQMMLTVMCPGVSMSTNMVFARGFNYVLRYLKNCVMCML